MHNIKSIADRRFLLGVNEEYKKLMVGVKKSNLTYLSYKKLRCLLSTLLEVESNAIDGCFVEAGCALGGSAILLAKLAQSRQIRIYDVFATIPPPSIEDPDEVHQRYREITGGASEGINGDRYYGYEENLLDKVKSNFRKFDLDPDGENIKLIQGLLEQTLDLESPVALAHIDVDWYEPVMVCLERIFPKVSVGGSIILDDYYDWGGCKKAVDKFFTGKEHAVIFSDKYGSMKITKTRDLGGGI